MSVSVLNGSAPQVDAAAAAAAVENTVKAVALRAALSDALNFTAPAAAKLPVLETVRVEAGGGNLIAVATDRFALGASRVDYAGAPFAATLSVADAKRLVAMAKCPKREESWREVAIVVAVDGALTFRFSTGEALTVRPVVEEYPAWRRLIPDTERRMGAVIGVAYDPTLLAKFAKVRPAEERRMALFAGMADSKLCGTAVTIGEDFVGLVMPQRPAGDEERYERPGWLAATPGGR